MINRDDIQELLDRMSGQDIVKKIEYPVIKQPVKKDDMKVSINFLDDILVTITAELGQATLKIRDILKLGEGSVIELEQSAGETAGVLINDQKFGRGEVVVIGGNFGIRIESVLQKEKKESLGKIL